ncbi:Thiamine biosynthesis lipoprotein ApbE precursor [Planctomycetes bacterium Pan216]|uniref:FAD:protein FMN transferase n=1 Tax=Kolteria novifilia TaxID=2527975 RepID=A0A518B2B6_9BACT|nr:Thiamine biosynthesis lipoprotein ApbE precursor [Planctomycetes bacterium Pan216]
MRESLLALVGVVLLAQGSVAADNLQYFEMTEDHWGEPIVVSLYAPDKKTAEVATRAAFERIRALAGRYSERVPESDVSKLNKAAGDKPVTVDESVYQAIDHGQKMGRRTNGAFDITGGPLVALWADDKEPTEKEVAEAKKQIGHDKIVLDPQATSVHLPAKGMRVDLNGMIKGHIADEALRAMQTHGIRQASLQIGRDVVVGEAPPGADGWVFTIEPAAGEAAPTEVAIKNTALATSGDLIIDPRTGKQIEGVQVSVIAKHAMTADALATVIPVLGPRKGLDLVESTPFAAAKITVEEPDGKVQVITSRRWKEAKGE